MSYSVMLCMTWLYVCNGYHACSPSCEDIFEDHERPKPNALQSVELTVVKRCEHDAAAAATPVKNLELCFPRLARLYLSELGFDGPAASHRNFAQEPEATSTRGACYLTLASYERGGLPLNRYRHCRTVADHF